MTKRGGGFGIEVRFVQPNIKWDVKRMDSALIMPPTATRLSLFLTHRKILMDAFEIYI